MSEEKQQKRNVPELRFPEFSGEWEALKLGDLGKVAMNKRIFKDETTLNGEIPFYKIGTFGKKPDSYITREKFNEYKENYPYPKVGDILISASGSIGKTVEYKGEDAYFQDSNIIWLEHGERVLNKFLKQYYQIVKWDGIEGTTIKRLYNKNVLRTEINLPTISEQQKLATFFSKLDQQIELEEKKLALLEEQKKGYMQKIFSQELRFKNENGNDYPEWEEKKLGEIAHITRGLTYKPTDIRPNGIRVLRSSNIIDNKFLLHEDDVFVDEKAVKIPLANVGDILITAANGSPKLVGKHALIKKIENKSVAGGFMYVLKAENTNFIQTWMNSKEYKRVISKVQGGNGSIGNLSKRDLERGLITIPNFEEQEKIGGFFDKIDKKNSKVQKKIQKLNELKKALLQKMFI